MRSRIARSARPRLALFALPVAAVLVSFAAPARTAPAPPARVAPSPGRPVPSPMDKKLSLAPALVYPPTGAVYEQTDLAHVNVYIAWTTNVPESEIHSFDVCLYRTGTSCGPLGDLHFGRAPYARKASLAVPVMADHPSWTWQVATCVKKGAGQGPCTWSEPRTVRVVAPLAAPELAEPAPNAKLTLPGTLTLRWKSVPGAEFYRVCNQPATFAASWLCTNTPTDAGTATLTVAPKPYFSRSYTTNVEITNLIGAAHDAQRMWGAEACHTVMEQQQDKPPVPVARCAHHDPRRYTATRTP
jgi:hypothetical protein